MLPFLSSSFLFLSPLFLLYLPLFSSLPSLPPSLLFSPSPTSLSSLLSPPYLPLLSSLFSAPSFSLPQREILEVLYSVFQLKEPNWTEDYQIAVASIGQSGSRRRLNVYVHHFCHPPLLHMCHTLHSHLPTITDPAQPQSEWALTEGWVAEEGKVLLPPKTVGRTNLIDCYHALLLAVFIEARLFEVNESLY